MMYSNPNYSVDPWHPPVPPQSFGFGAQDTISYGDKTGASTPFAIAMADSMDSVAEKAQQDPQPPWFFVGVKTPLLFLKSTLSG
jgi:hypothetical protein